MTKYPMKTKTDRPLFECLVRDNMHLDYYLFDEFDKALKQAGRVSVSGGRHILIYENHFNTNTKGRGITVQRLWFFRRKRRHPVPNNPLPNALAARFEMV